MANNDNLKLISNDKQQRGNKTATKFVIITSVDEDNDQILSKLNPSNVETFVLDLNDTNMMNTFKLNQKNSKRSLSQSVGF
jgi:hypothetical protein